MRTLEITAVWLRSTGGESGPQGVEVLAEIGGLWVPLIKYGVENVGGAISHIIERPGIVAALEHEAKEGRR